jgi:hypothetical protein
VTPFFPEPGPEPADRPVDPEGNGFQTAGPGAKPVAAPVSRWAKSDVTFGPVGRVVCTLLVVAVGGWFLTVSIFGLIGAALWWLVVTPWALRDLWRPVARSRR